MIRISYFLLAFVLLSFLALSAILPAACGAQDAKTAKLDLIKRGVVIYKVRCLVCHTAGGKSPNPRMRFADHEWVHGDKPEQIQKVIAEGIKGTAMMGFKNRLSTDDIKAVAAYILDLSEKSKE